MSAIPKVAHFIHFDGRGGGPVVASQLAEGLSKDFEQVVFLAGRGKFRSACANAGIPVVEVPTHSLLLSFFAIFILARLLKKHKVDILILHGQWAGPIGSLAARLALTPHSIYISHCPAFYHSTTLFKVIRNYIAEKIPCHSADLVVALSEGNYYNYLFRGWVPESRLVQIPNGINPTSTPSDCERRNFRSKHGWNEAARHAIFVGRLDDQKRPDWLVEAWAIALTFRIDKASPWELWVVGDGEERFKCEALAKKLGVADSIHFVGNQPEGLSWLNASDLVIMTSLYEGHSLVPLEAMMCSRAVTAFATDGITDSVKDGKTGLLCEIGDIAALASHIGQLLNDDEKRKELGHNGYSFVCETFPLSKSIARYRQLITSLLANEENQEPNLATN